MYKGFFKRLFDFLISLLFLPFILLLIIVVAPFIYFTDKGPIFYNAMRAGKDGKSFKMFKFRSMYVNSPDLRNADGSTFNSNQDPRVTPIGRFLRKTSIDELPQLLNVLIGDMSFIGPRPTLPVNDRWHELGELHRKRYAVRPGITGYAQAYYRNSITQDEKFKYDSYYIDNISMMIDIKVFIKTILSVVKSDNVFVENK